jgi:hypothetical protein
MQAKALEIASHVTHPVTVAALALVFAATAFGLAMKARKTRLAWLLAAAIITLGLGPLAASTYLQSRGVYRIRVVVNGLDGQPVDNAEVTASIGGEVKKAAGSWELEVPVQTRPADGKITVYASVKDSYLAGHTDYALTDEFYPTVPVRLDHLPSVSLRGMVTDEAGRSVPGARVSIPGNPEIVITDEAGNFSIPAHAAYGQRVVVHAEKNGLIADRAFPAGVSQAELKLHKP